MFSKNLKTSVLTSALLGIFGTALAVADYQVTFDVTTDLQDVFVSADEFNGDVYAWDLFPYHLGNVNAGTTIFQLGGHDLAAWAILAMHGPTAAATGINDSINPPDGLPFETVFPGYTESVVADNIANLYVNGAYNVLPAYALFDFVLTNEDTLKTDLPTGTLHIYTFSNAVNVGTATFRSVPPPTPGDLNCDGAVNFDDINAFVVALSGPAGYVAQFPNCNWFNGDCNGDGSVNFDDINAFVALLSGQ